MKPLPLAARIICYVGPLLLLMLVMFLMSTDTGSSQHTTEIIVRFVKTVPGFSDITPVQIDKIDYNVRKAAHVIEYTLFALLAFRAVSFGNRRFRHRYVLLPLAIGFLFAVSDEYHQSFEPSRTAAAADIVFDVFGLTAGLLICLWRQLTRERAQNASCSLAERNPLR